MNYNQLYMKKYSHIRINKHGEYGIPIQKLGQQVLGYWLEDLDEIIIVERKAELGLNINHIKVCNFQNQEVGPVILEWIDHILEDGGFIRTVEKVKYYYDN